jgi:hypothetical protein
LSNNQAMKDVKQSDQAEKIKNHTIIVGDVNIPL